MANPSKYLEAEGQSCNKLIQLNFLPFRLRFFGLLFEITKNELSLPFCLLFSFAFPFL